ncbi:MAG: LysM peptidoglycan-binding domain-containing protein [Deltaproteobacteria bacterium]|nr:LysM peptidoglycan-binding domain-containing protein [Deltaproteobacteria bacterium]
MGNSTSPIEKVCCLLILAVFVLFAGSSAAQESLEETYSMDFVQTAELDKEVFEVEDRKVLTETYTVREGDHIWQIFRERGLLEKSDLYDLIAVLKKLNGSLEDIDLIHPGQNIIIPLQISPGAGTPSSARKGASIPLSIEELKDKDIRNYIVRPGDSLIKVVNNLYDIPRKHLYNEYLEVLKDLNPDLKNLDKIYPGQSVRLPIYSPKVVRMPIKPPPVYGQEETAGTEDLKEMAGKLEEIFTLLGEEWIGSGKHFIPLKTGGQISLNADSYPVINLVNGNKIIVDINSDLPERISGLIKSNWDNYRIVHLNKKNDFRQSFDDIISNCGYRKVYRSGESVEIKGDINIRINADWTVMVEYDQPAARTGFRVINIMEERSRIPRSIIDFLEGLDVKVIEYPVKQSYSDREEAVDIFYAPDSKSIVETLIDLQGLRYKTDIEIPLYQSKQEDFRLIIEADYLMDIGEKTLIIDTSGLGTEIISLLKENQYGVLQLSTGDNPSNLVKKTLDFLGIKYDSPSIELTAANRYGENNIYLKIPGITFIDNEAKTIFATPLSLPEDISRFLSSKGYRIMMLTQVD